MGLPRDEDGSVNMVGRGSVLHGVARGIGGMFGAIGREMRDELTRPPTLRGILEGATGVSTAQSVANAGRGFRDGWRAATGTGGRPSGTGFGSQFGPRSGSVVAQGFWNRPAGPQGLSARPTAARSPSRSEQLGLPRPGPGTDRTPIQPQGNMGPIDERGMYGPGNTSQRRGGHTMRSLDAIRGLDRARFDSAVEEMMQGAEAVARRETEAR